MRKKIIAYSVILIILSILIMSFSSSKILINNAENNNLLRLETFSSVINKAIEEELRGGVKPDYVRIAELFSKEISERITFIDKDGKVLADSTLGKNYINTDNHKYREEVKEALAGKIGVSTRKSGTYGKVFLYVATPMFYQGNMIVITRVAMEVSELNKMDDFIIKTTLISGLIGVLLAIIISSICAGLITRPIKAAIRFAENIMDRKYDSTLYINSKDELGDLGDRLKDISVELKSLENTNREDAYKSQAVLNNMKEAIIAVDTEFHLTMINKAAKEMFQLSDSDIGEYLIRAIRNSNLLTAFKRVINEEYIGEQIIEFDNDKTYRLRSEYIKDHAQKNIGIIALIEDISGASCKFGE
ncbi:MAG: PAS domain-containing protein [Eubacteriales bacterium]